MTNKPSTGRDKGRAHPAALAGLALLVLGLVAWLWSGDWRWAISGLALLLVGALIAAARTQP